MFYNVAIPRSWLMSRRARRCYFLCAIGSVLLLFDVFGIAAANVFLQSGNLAVLFAVVALPLTIAAALLWVAMAYFWLTVDIRQRGAGPVWAITFLLGWFGAVLYYAVRYRPVSRKLVEADSGLASFSHGAGF